MNAPYLPLPVRALLDCGEVVDLLSFDSPELLSRYNTVVSMNDAISRGCLRVLQLLRPRSLRQTRDQLLMAIEYGQYELVDYLHHECTAQEPDPNTEHYIVAAVDHDSLSILEYLCLRGYSWSYCTLAAAARAGRLDMMRYLCSVGAQTIHWNECVYSSAVMSSCLDMVRYVEERGCPRPSNIGRLAIEVGDVKIVEYLHSTGLAYIDRACTLAIQRGGLGVVNYLRNHGYSWDENAAQAIVAFGRTEIVEYLRLSSCPDDQRLYQRLGALRSF